MTNIDISNYELVESDDVFTYKNENTTLGFVRFNAKGEVEYIFVNPIFRKQGLAKKLLRLVREKTCLLYTSPSPRDRTRSRMPSSA